MVLRSPFILPNVYPFFSFRFICYKDNHCCFSLNKLITYVNITVFFFSVEFIKNFNINFPNSIHFNSNSGVGGVSQSKHHASRN